MLYYNESKQHLGISFFSSYIMNCDYFAFTGKQKKGKWVPAGFLNRIFVYFLSDPELAKKVYTENIGKNYSKDVQFAFRPNIEVCKLLSRLEKSKYLCEEYYREEEYGKNGKQFYLVAGRLYKSVYEEYARLPFYKREQVYFKKAADTINKAIKMGKNIGFDTNKGTFTMTPYMILNDEWSTHNYVIGLNSERKVVNNRLTRMDTVFFVNEESNITEDEEKMIKTQIEKAGIRFAQGQPKMIKLHLTPSGIALYNDMEQMRPRYMEYDEENSIYTFNCTTKQIRYYFWRFGADVEILEPKWLRDEFAREYKKAAKLYE